MYDAQVSKSKIPCSVQILQILYQVFYFVATSFLLVLDLICLYQSLVQLHLIQKSNAYHFSDIPQ